MKAITKNGLLFFSLVMMVASVSAQATNDNIPKVIPPSPNAAAIEKYTSMPVNYSTGIPQVSYPMWSWKRNRLSYSVGLSYHAGGNRVDEMASSVGLGWSIQNSFVISRTVRGLPDETPVYGFWNSAPLEPIVTYDYNPEEYYRVSQVVGNLAVMNYNHVINQYNYSYDPALYNRIKEICENQLDGEQDIFNYSIGNRSGRFVVDKNKNVVPLEKTPIKIIPSLGGASNTIAGFKIIDESGLEYYFTILENQLSQTITNSQAVGGATLTNYTSAWWISSIKDVLSNESIVFNYAFPNVAGINPAVYENGFSQSETFELTKYNNTSPCAPGAVVLSFQRNTTNSHQSITVNTPQLSSVQLPDGSVVNFLYLFDRVDFKNTKALTGIRVFNMNNQLVKQFRLNFSYFSSGDITSFQFGSTNDYNKRLRLDGVEEISNDAQSSKLTAFTYNNLVLNNRGSANVDFWGFNVNPARNNIGYIPETKLEAVELRDFPELAGYLPGSDRRPDADYCKASLLEKISYPTGGFTSFEYEPNKAFSAVNYYEDKVNIPAIRWSQSSFNAARSLGTLPDRNQQGVRFYCKVNEQSPRSSITAPISCLADGQDNVQVKVEINSTDGTVSRTIQAFYTRFLGGFYQVVDLPLGKDYTIKFVYPTDNCFFIYPFTAEVQTQYFIEPIDKLAGGVRVKKITMNDGFGRTITKEYAYSGTDGRSSASLNVVPNFGYNRVANTVLTPPFGLGGQTTCFSHELLIKHLSRSSSPVIPFASQGGAPLVYTRVIEKDADGGTVERYFDQISQSHIRNKYPWVPYQDFPNLSGLLLKEVIKDNTGALKQVKEIAYNKYAQNLVGNANRNWKTGMVASAAHTNAKCYVIDNYTMFFSHAEEIKSVTTQYENGQVLRQEENKTYDAVTTNLATQTVTNSKGENLRSVFTYPTDVYTTSAIYADMVNKNMIAAPVAIAKRKMNNTAHGVLLENLATNYGTFNGMPYPATIQKALYGNALETEITFDRYDTKGNILQYTAKDGVVTCFIWGYNSQYPVAKIVGISYSDAIAQSGIDLSVINNPSNDVALRNELNKIRNLPGNLLVSTYTYIPLLGVTSETDANGRTIYYEYDTFNRLRRVKDKDGNIVKVFDYQYQANQ